MVNLQHYIHYKLQDKQIVLGSLEGGREGWMDFTHAFSLIQTNVKS